MQRNFNGERMVAEVDLRDLGSRIDEIQDFLKLTANSAYNRTIVDTFDSLESAIEDAEVAVEDDLTDETDDEDEEDEEDEDDTAE